MSTDPASEEYSHQVKSPQAAFTANDPGTNDYYIQCPLTLHQRNMVTKSSHSNYRLSAPTILAQVTTIFNVHQPGITRHRLLSLPMIQVQVTTTFSVHQPCTNVRPTSHQVKLEKLSSHSHKDTQTNLLVSEIKNTEYTYHTQSLPPPPLPRTYTHMAPPPHHTPTVREPKNTFESGSTKLCDIQFQIPGTGVARVLALGLRQAAQTITPQGCFWSPAGYCLSVPLRSFASLWTCLSHYTPAFANTINTHGVGSVFSVVHFLFRSTGRAFLKRVTSFVRYCQHILRFTLLKDPSLYHQTLVQELLHSLAYSCDDVNAQRGCLNSQQCLLHNLEHCLCRFYQLKHDKL